MNKIRFREIVSTLMGIAATNGAAWEVEDDAFIARFPDVAVTVFVDDGPIGAHWHSASRDLAPAPFDSINDVHKRKATQWRKDWPAMFSALEQSCAAIADGTAFA